MELPTTIQDCQALIRDLVEENEALRKAGADFGRLAERLNLALQEERLRARDQSGRRPVRSSIRKPKPLVSDDAVGRWSGGHPGRCRPSLDRRPRAAVSSASGFPVRRPRAAKFIL